jgi:hypothetical protein
LEPSQETIRGGTPFSPDNSGEQEAVILHAGTLPFQSAPAKSAQVEGGGTGLANPRGETLHQEPQSETMPVGWFGDRKRIRSGTGIRVARFHVWQDLSGSGDGNLAPIHATVALEVSNEWYSSLTTPGGTIRLEITGGQEVLDARLVLHHAHYDLEPAQFGSHRRLQFVVSPTPIHSRLHAGETVRGVAKMKFWNRKVTLKLPETQVQFTR